MTLYTDSVTSGTWIDEEGTERSGARVRNYIPLPNSVSLIISIVNILLITYE